MRNTYKKSKFECTLIVIELKLTDHSKRKLIANNIEQNMFCLLGQLVVYTQQAGHSNSKAEQLIKDETQTPILKKHNPCAKLLFHLQ